MGITEATHVTKTTVIVVIGYALVTTTVVVTVTIVAVVLRVVPVPDLRAVLLTVILLILYFRKGILVLRGGNNLHIEADVVAPVRVSVNLNGDCVATFAQVLSRNVN